MKAGVPDKADDAPSRGGTKSGEPVGPVRILLVEEHDDSLEALTEWIADNDDVELVGTARTRAEAVRQAQALDPELVLVDVGMTYRGGLDMMRTIKSRPSAPLTVILTFHEREIARQQMLACEADDFVTRAEITERLAGFAKTQLARRRARGVAPAIDKQRSSTQRVPPREITS